MSRPAWLKIKRTASSASERGAALVESAIVMVPLCIIIFGIIEFGFIFKDSLSISNASRSGARIASAEPKDATFFADTVGAIGSAGTGAGFANGDKLWIYAVSSTVNTDGKMPTGSPDQCTAARLCRLYTWNGTGWTGDTTDSGIWPSSSHKVCLGSDDIQSVGVQLQVTHKALTGFFGNLNNLKLTERTVMRLEPQENASTC